MDSFVKQTLEASGAIPPDYVNLREHSSNLRENSTSMLNPNDFASDKVYTWTQVTKDPIVYVQLRELYSFEREEKCLFPWEIRNVLGNWFCPSNFTSSNLFSKTKYRHDVLAQVVVDKVESIYNESDRNAFFDYIPLWINSVKGSLEDLYKEMEEKLTQEKQIVLTHKFTVEIKSEKQNKIPSHITLYTDEKPKETNENQNDNQKDNKTLHSGRMSVGEFKTLDDVRTDLRKEKANLQLLQKSIDNANNEIHYHTISLATCAKALLIVYIISIPFSVLCIDGYALMLTTPFSLFLGIWGYVLAYFIPKYKTLVFYTVFSWIACFSYFIYVFLRSFFYNFGECNITPLLCLLWILWTLSICIAVFSTTLTGTRKKIEDWHVHINAPSQMNVIKQK